MTAESRPPRAGGSGGGGRGQTRGSRVLTWSAVVLLVIGLTRILHPQGAASGPPAAPNEGEPGGINPAYAASAAPMSYSLPVHIEVPATGIDADLMSIGLTADHSLGVPPLDQAQKAAWYDLGPAPGQAGPAVIDAHVDSLEVRGFHGAFYNLGSMRPGETIDVTRADHAVAEFTVDYVQEAPKASFPTSTVYGTVPYAALRLITCGGDFDYATHSYTDNTIVYAHLTATRGS